MLLHCFTGQAVETGDREARVEVVGAVGLVVQEEDGETGEEEMIEGKNRPSLYTVFAFLQKYIYASRQYSVTLVSTNTLRV